MATRIPLVMNAGNVQQLQAGDTLSGAGLDGGAITFRYTFSSTTTDSDPGNGVLRLDNATQNTAATIFIDLLDSLGETLTAVLDSLDVSTNTNNTGQIRLISVADPTKWLIFDVQAVLSVAGYRQIVVLNRASSDASPLTNGETIVFAFCQSGDRGAAGSNGTNGTDALSPPNGRLTPVSGDADGTSTAATTIYYTPYEGHKISLYSGAAWVNHTLTEISIAVPSTLFRMFDVFVYNNAGTLTLEIASWSQSTAAITAASNASPIVITSNAHGLSNGDLVGIAGIGGNTAANGYVWQVASVAANTFALVGSTGNGAYTSGGTWYKVNGSTPTALALQDGILVRNSDHTRRYIGCGFTHGVSGTIRVDASYCHLANAYNQLDLVLLVSESTSHTYASATGRPWNNDGRVYVSFVVPQNKPTVAMAVCNPLIATPVASAVPEVGIGINTTNAFTTSVVLVVGVSVTLLTPGANPHSCASGFNLASAVELCPTGTGTFTQVAIRMGIVQ